MTKRWLAGIALFAIGFGCAQVIQVTTADAQDEELDEGLLFGDDGDKYVLTNTGDNAYIVVVHRDDDTLVVEPAFGSKKGTAEFSKQDLIDLTIHRITTVGKVVVASHPPFSVCDPPQDFSDCPLPRPDPIPPRPFTILEP